MPAYLTLSVFGVFVLDEDGKVISEHLFYPDADLAATALLAVSNEELTKDIENSVVELEGKEIIVEDAVFARAISQVKGSTVRVEEGGAPRWFRDNHDNYLIEQKIVPSREDIALFRREVSITLAKNKVSAASEEKDLLIKNAIDAVDEIDKSFNVLVMRLREWYSLHHPSLGRLIEDQEIFAKILSACAGKSDISRDCLQSAGVPDSLVEQIFKALPGDIGADLQDSDFVVISNLAKSTMNLYQMRSELESYISIMMESVAPNIGALAGPMIGARLISLAGSLKELARKPSSTIQVFGAEKALFRSLKTGSDPPKHGIIYRIPEVNSAPYWQRGKIARAIAGKLSIAARIDAYSEKDVGEDLKGQFISRLEEIRAQNPNAPPPKPSKPKPEQRRKPERKRRSKKRRGGH
ncbi:MAG: C/D box methylation guide ribonucleoprotein complex aNOP56 subunit [Candidatus Thorarchaeota archaeon]|nr:C/D box methylation guide ribonucleoprotein complex aNOP56 subunit [Candidatus Thorarchaeota archaeon]